MAYHLGTEAVVPEEDVADPCYQDSGRVTPRSRLHAADLHIAARVRDVDKTHDDTAYNRGGNYSDCHPSHYVHVELLSVSGSTSSGAKYR
jgi:hypothetical protein